MRTSSRTRALLLSRSRRRVARIQPVVANMEIKTLRTKSDQALLWPVLPDQTMVAKHNATPRPACHRAAERFVRATMSDPARGASVTSPAHATGASPRPPTAARMENLGGRVLTVGTPIDEKLRRDSGRALVRPRITANTCSGEALV